MSDGGRRVLRGPSPIVVGVSGHRDLRAQDGAALARSVDEFFARMRARFPDSDLLVLTGLARGADQLVAERAAAHGVDFIAVLPMPLEAYREDFEPAERAGFEALLARALGVVELPFAGGHSAASLRADRVARAGQYGRLAGYLVANSAVLLALWNGRPADAAGGTGAVVALATAAGNGSSAGAFVYRIETPRASDPPAANGSVAGATLPGDDPALAPLAEIDLWNREARRLLRARPEPDGIVPDGRLASRAFELADELARRDQAQTQRAIETVYWSALVAGSALVVYGNLSDFFAAFARPFYGLSLVFLLATLVSVATVFRLHRADVQNRFHDYRALAEGLRVQKVFLDAGIAIDASERYLAKHQAELAWIRRTVAGAYLVTSLARSAALRAGPSWTGLAEVRRSWVDAQRAYFERAAERNAGLARRSNRWAIGWFRLSIAAGFLVACDGALRLVGGAGLGGLWRGALDLKPLLLSLLAWSALLAALGKGRANLLGYGLLAARYRAMCGVFGAASQKLARLLETRGDGDLARAVAVITELGDEALAENAEWLLSQRDRPLELVWAG